MTRTRCARLALPLLGIWLAGCDDRNVFHRPEPGLERMLLQERGAPYTASHFFADGRVMREPPPFTRPREATAEARATTDASAAPPTRAFLERGQSEFERVCATCHGLLGDGVSVVAQKMELRAPPSLHEPRIVALPRARVFAIISQGYGLMPALAGQIAPGDRWAIVAYLDALRLSRAVPVARLPAALRAELEREGS